MELKKRAGGFVTSETRECDVDGKISYVFLALHVSLPPSSAWAEKELSLCLLGSVSFRLFCFEFRSSVLKFSPQSAAFLYKGQLGSGLTDQAHKRIRVSNWIIDFIIKLHTKFYISVQWTIISSFIKEVIVINICFHWICCKTPFFFLKKWK